MLAGFAREAAGEQREPCPVAVKLCGSQVAEVQRREVPLDQTFCEAVCADLIDLDARETVVLAVAAEVAFVDPVVTEGAEVEVCKWIARVTESAACRRPDPERRISEREKKSAGVFPPDLRKELGKRVVRAGRSHSTALRFRLRSRRAIFADSSKPASPVAPTNLRMRRGYVLIVGQPVQAGIAGQIDESDRACDPNRE